MKSALRGFAFAICFFLGTALLFSQAPEEPKPVDDDPATQSKLGSSYYEGSNGVHQDYAKALEYFTKAAEKNDAQAIRYLGVLYFNGQGVTKDLKKALDFSLRAADLGDSIAQKNVAVIYLNGLGVEKDIGKAIAYAEQSAAHENPDGYYMLGLCLSNDASPKKNLATAFQCFVMAAYKGNVDAKYKLAIWYEKGFFVEKNLSMAYAWSYLGPDNDQRFVTLRNSLTSRMTRAELEESNRILADYYSGIFLGHPVEMPRVYFPDHEKHVIKLLPFRNWLLVSVDIGDRKGLNFIVDTGASSTMIDSKLAEELHLPKGLAENIDVVGMYHSSAYLTKCEKLSIGDIQISHLNPVINSFDEVNSVLSQPISGIIGNDILSQCVVTIDYIHRTITWQAPEDFKESEDHGIPVNFYFSINCPYIEPRFKNHEVWSKPTPLEIDTGSGGTVELDQIFIKDNPDLKLNQLLPTESFGLGGLQSDSMAMCQSLELAPSLVITNPILSIAQKSNGTIKTIGGEILKRFDVTLDFSRKRIFLKPNENFGKPFKPVLANFGFKEVDDPHGKIFKVVMIVPGSQDAQAGLQKDDVIIQINDLKGDKLSDESIRDALRIEGPCTLVIERDGKQQTIQLNLKNPFATPAPAAP